VLHENIPSDRLELRKSVEELISIAPNLKKLLLSLSHVDLNATNVSGQTLHEPVNHYLNMNLQILIASQGPPRLIGLLDWELSKYLPFGIDGAQIRYMSVINRDRVDCPEEPGSTMVATSFWNAFTRSLPANLKNYVVDAMKIGMIIYLEFPECRREREARDIQNAENRFQWFDDVFRPLCLPRCQ
jgi:hypothetical protein